MALKTGGGSTPTSSTIHYVYDVQGKLIGEYTGPGALMREYVEWGQVLPFARSAPTLF